MPRQVYIPVAQKHFHFQYWLEPGRTQVRCLKHATQIEFLGCVNDRKALKTCMRKWLIELARTYFSPRLESFSANSGLAYRQLRIKNHKTLWGSCSELGNINLNLKLLFLPMDLVDYVLLHELCHLKHLNHSKAFWALLALYCPAYQLREEALKKADALIPKWVHRL